MANGPDVAMDQETLEEMVTEQLRALKKERPIALIESRAGVNRHLGVDDRWGVLAGDRAIALSCYADGSGSILFARTLERADHNEWRETDDSQQWKFKHNAWGPDVPLDVELDSELSWLGRPRPPQDQGPG